MTYNETLFQAYQLGPLELANRIVMAPMTRNRSGEGDAPTEMNAKYYEQRASAGLIVTEATKVSPEGVAYPGTPGIYSPEQVAGWKKVTAAVHEAGGRIFVQLWHGGRVSHPSLQPEGRLPVAPSAIAPAGETVTLDGMKPFETPRALEIAEIEQIVEQYRDAAMRAREAGFDGVEIHAANGYLIDQFLRDGANQRKDMYGGSITNRARFLFDVVYAVISVWGGDRVGVRLSPSGTFNSMRDSAPSELFDFVARGLSSKSVGYVHIVEPGPDAEGAGPDAAGLNSAHFRPLVKGALIAAGGYDRESGSRAVREGTADLVAYARLYLANPDLPQRFALDAELNAPDPETFYQGGEKGYIDYPTLEAAGADQTV